MSEVFTTIHAAKLADVAPWDLEAQSLYWRNHILEKASVEAKANKDREKRDAQKRARQGRRR